MGFLKQDDGSDDLFVHRSDLVDGDWLAVGSQVTYDVGMDPKRGKPIAKNCAGASSGKGGGGRFPVASTWSPGWARSPNGEGEREDVGSRAIEITAGGGLCSGRSVLCAQCRRLF